MIVKISGWQDTGKTALAVGLTKELLRIGSYYENGYRPTDIVANLHLNPHTFPGAHCINNDQMRTFISKMVTHALRHKIVILDEADRRFPARFWHHPKQTEALIGLWQDVKLFNWIIYTCHLGSSIDVILRQTAQIELEPSYDEKADCIDFIVYNAVYGEVYEDGIDKVMTRIFQDYDRWEPIGVKDDVALTL